MDMDEASFSIRPGANGSRRLGYAVRMSCTVAFSTPMLMPELNSASDDGEAFISADGTELNFTSLGSIGSDLYRVVILKGP